VRTGFLGLEAVQVNWARDRYPVRVIYDEAVRHQGDALARLPLSLPDGRVVYLGDVAELTLTRGLSTIHRRDGQRLATITAEVDSSVTTPLQVTERIQRAAGDSLADMKRALVISLAINHLQFLSLVGFLALTGIVVNDSLILVDFYLQARRRGLERIEAMVQAGRVRIRPILLTSITTFLGISPLIFFASGQTRFLSPMAVSLGFGLLFATVLILVALPCFYLIADDLRSRVLRGLHQSGRTTT